MKVLPLSYMENLTDEQILEFDCSDRIYVPKAEFTRWMNESEPGIATILSLTNRLEQKVNGFLFGVTHESDTIYVPHRMYKALDMDTDDITIERIQPSLCTRVTLQPFTSDHCSSENPLELFRDAFERYTCLSVGDEVSLWIGYPVQAIIAGLEPPVDEPLCIRGCELELDLLKPLDMPEEEPAPEPAPTPPVPENVIEHVDADGHRLGGSEDATKTLRQKMLEAAQRRLNEAQKKE